MAGDLILFLVVVIAPTGLMAAVGLYWARRRGNALRALEASAPPPALDAFPTLDQLLDQPARWREQLADRVQLVNAMSTPIATEGVAIDVYTAYVLDRNGQSHDLVESGDEQLVVAAAAWTAHVLGVPLKNDTFAKPDPDPDKLIREIRRRIAKRRAEREGHAVLMTIVSLIAGILAAASYTQGWGLTLDFGMAAIITAVAAVFGFIRRPRKL